MTTKKIKGNYVVGDPRSKQRYLNANTICENCLNNDTFNIHLAKMTKDILCADFDDCYVCEQKKNVYMVLDVIPKKNSAKN